MGRGFYTPTRSRDELQTQIATHFANITILVRNSVRGKKHQRPILRFPLARQQSTIQLKLLDHWWNIRDALDLDVVGHWERFFFPVNGLMNENAQRVS